MVKFILFVWISTGGGVGGPAFAEFDSRQACEDAKREIIAAIHLEYNEWLNLLGFVATCVPKTRGK